MGNRGRAGVRLVSGSGRSRDVEVAIVGGGPAGALTAMLLARLGHEVALFERAPRWRWRACGVFSSPASVAALARLGVPAEEMVRIASPVTGMEVITEVGTRFALTYGGSGALEDSAVGFDRGALDPVLLALAREAGAQVHDGVAIDRVELGRGTARHTAGAARERLPAPACFVAGADGLRSSVALAAGTARRAPISPRAALTFHVPDPGLEDRARMAVIRDGYVGLAPVPGDRVNVGIVLGRSWFAALRRDGGSGVARQALRLALARAGLDRGSRGPSAGIASPAGDLEPLDRVAGVTPVAHAVRRRAGDGWLLVGDAAGFLDPFTGEGLHRAIRSAELAAETIHAASSAAPGTSGVRLDRYDAAMREAFATKDVVSRIVQGFLGYPALFEYAARRLRARNHVRDTMGLVMGDLVPASRALDPRYLLALLRP
jgi:flavin-dependent dehydrogenase